MKHLEQLDHSSAGDKRWQLSCLAAQLLAAAPPAIGGLSVRASQGPVLDAWLTNVSKLFADCPVIRLPPHISDERLVGGLDLTETLRNGGPRYTASVLTRADRGLVVIPAADRLDEHSCDSVHEDHTFHASCGMRRAGGRVQRSMLGPTS